MKQGTSLGANRTAISKPTLGNWLSILTLGLVWGGAFLGIALTLRGYGPVQTATGRLTLGAIAMIAIALLLPRSDGPRPTRAHVPYFLLIGFFGAALPFLLLSWGQTRVSSGFAGVAMSSVALFVLPLAHFFVPGDTLNWRKGAGFLLGFLGVVILLGPGLVTEGWSGPETLGRLACLGAACCYAIGSLTTRLAPPVDPIALALSQLVVGAAFLFPFMLATEGFPTDFPRAPTLALLALALLPTALAAYLRVTVIRSAGPTFMSSVGFQVPIWAVIFGILILGEPVSESLFIALALILAGMALTQVRRRS